MINRDFRQRLANWIYKPKKEIKIEVTEDFVAFPCECGEQVILQEQIMPGDAAVLECRNCQTSWTVYNPSLVVKRTKELPEELQQVWAELAG